MVIDYRLANFGLDQLSHLCSLFSTMIEYFRWWWQWAPPTSLQQKQHQPGC